MTRCTAAGLLAIVMLTAACNQHVSVIDSPVSPTQTVLTPSATTTVVAAPGLLPPPSIPGQPDVATVNLLHSAVPAGESIRGVVNLYSRAGERGALVALSADDDAVRVPPTVTVPAGENMAEFTVVTAAVAYDLQTVVTARTPGKSVVAALAVWSALPEFFHWFSDPDDPIGDSGYNRYHPGHSNFSATCEGNVVRVEIEAPADEHWSLWFKAPSGVPLRIGAYDAVTAFDSDSANATMFIEGRGRSCDDAHGRFRITELDLQGNRVNRFRVSFDHQCGSSGYFHGEVRVAGSAVRAPAAGCQR